MKISSFGCEQLRCPPSANSIGHWPLMVQVHLAMVYQRERIAWRLATVSDHRDSCGIAKITFISISDYPVLGMHRYRFYPSPVPVPKPKPVELIGIETGTGGTDWNRNRNRWNWLESKPEPTRLEGNWNWNRIDSIGTGTGIGSTRSEPKLAPSRLDRNRNRNCEEPVGTDKIRSRLIDWEMLRYEREISNWWYGLDINSWIFIVLFKANLNSWCNAESEVPIRPHCIALRIVIDGSRCRCRWLVISEDSIASRWADHCSHWTLITRRVLKLTKRSRIQDDHSNEAFSPRLNVLSALSFIKEALRILFYYRMSRQYRPMLN